MKIGILTLPLRHNYGGILQAYALQTVLKRMGHDAYIVRFAPHRLFLLQCCMIRAKNICKRLLGLPPSYLSPSESKLNGIIYKHSNRFISEKMSPNTRVITNMRQLRRLDKEHLFDAYVVGSDQVWRKEYALKFLPAYFTTFTNRKIQRIAFAASFATSHWNVTSREIATFRDAIVKFNLVSVREESGIDICSEFLNCKAKLVLDPTMLLSREDYLELLDNRTAIQKKGVFEYILDRTPFKEEQCRKVRTKLGISSYKLNVPGDWSNSSLKEQVMSPVEEWIQNIYQAEYVVTDSFHGCVFSIIFNKPFVVIGNTSRGLERFRTLLKHFGLEDLLKSVEEDFQIENGNFDWNRINSIWEELKLYSIELLNGGLNDGI